MNGTFASPSYPGRVTSAVTCRWTIHVPARRNVNLRLTVQRPPSVSGNTTPETGCRDSYVQVMVSYSNNVATGMNLLGTYCTDVSSTYIFQFHYYDYEGA